MKFAGPKQGTMNTNIGIDFEEKTVRSADGTSIWYVVCGEGPHTLVLAPGLATPFISYKRILQRFAPHLRIIAWDMRGAYRSAVPEAGVAACRIEDHVADLEAIVEAEHLDHFILGGWSAAVQISLEYTHQHPEKVDGLLLINGPYGHILEHAFPLPGGLSEPVMHAAVVALQKMGPMLNPLIHCILGSGATIKALHLASIVTANLPFFREVVDDFRTLEFGRYFGMMQRVAEHSAEAYLDEVDVPTLITAGTKDRMTPPESSEFMARRTKNSELVIISDGSHYTPIEFPDLLNRSLRTFFERVYPEVSFG